MAVSHLLPPRGVRVLVWVVLILGHRREAFLGQLQSYVLWACTPRAHTHTNKSGALSDLSGRNKNQTLAGDSNGLPERYSSAVSKWRTPSSYTCWSNAMPPASAIGGRPLFPSARWMATKRIERGRGTHMMSLCNKISPQSQGHQMKKWLKNQRPGRTGAFPTTRMGGGLPTTHWIPRPRIPAQRRHRGLSLFF